MNARKYATRFLLIMTCILGFAAAPGPIYAQGLADCVADLAGAKTCFDNNTGAVTTVTLTRFRNGGIQCLIQSGSARMFLVSDFIGLDPSNLNLTCVITITNLPACNRGDATDMLTRKEQAAWKHLVRAECLAAECEAGL